MIERLDPELTPRDADRLRDWIRACERERGALPEGVTPVRGRLIRQVGRGELPDLGPAYLKIMAFPRLRDRVRYSIRPLPAEHEAHLFRRIGSRAPHIATPRVLAVAGRRAGRVPLLSILVTEALPIDPSGREAEVAEVAHLARQLAEVGVFHPDLHPANTPRLSDGRLALLDLQSARLRRSPLSRALRLRMAEKLASPPTTAILDAVVAAGLIDADDAGRLADRADQRQRDELDRRVRRCLTTSSEYEVARGLRATRVARRDLPVDVAVRVGGRALRAAWIGDRALQIFDGRPPLFAALEHDRLWLGGRYRLYIPRSTDPGTVDRRWPELLEGHQRWRQFRAGRESWRCAADRSVGAS